MELKEIDFFLGDSILRRMLTNMGMDNFKSGNNKICINLCIGGQTILNLKRRLRFSQSDNSMWHFDARNATLVIMIGTNDVIKGTNSTTFKRALKWTVNDLMKMGTKKILICTIPPLKKYDVTPINTIILELCSKISCVHIVDIYNEFKKNNDNLHERSVILKN